MLYLFHSLEFMAFFCFIFIAYWLIPKRFKNTLLLLVSYVFYGSWSLKLLPLLIASTIADYLCGLKMAHDPARKKWYLLASLTINLGMLGFFKYFNFFIDNLVALSNSIGIPLPLAPLQIILPIGISFYTFQKLSYTIDVYRGNIPAERSIIDFSLFVAYFPQLIAGPIERASDLIPRIKVEKNFGTIRWKESIYLFVYGLFKKIVLADSVAQMVDIIYANPDPTGTQVIIGTIAFALQIYCDFSAYSDMAKGLSGLLGIELTTNFNLPYFSQNPAEFWRRWHITLSNWVKDYLYIPLGGNLTRWQGLFPLFTSWLLMGLWHGAAWHFVVWGFYWFVLVYGHRTLFKKESPEKRGWEKVISIIGVFLLTCYGWIIFRASSLTQAVMLTEKLFSISPPEFLNIVYIPLYVSVLFLGIYESCQYLKNDQLFLLKTKIYIQIIFYLALFFLYLEIGGVVDAPYIYFQF